jgi:hypothetical protein
MSFAVSMGICAIRHDLMLRVSSIGHTVEPHGRNPVRARDPMVPRLPCRVIWAGAPGDNSLER